MSVVTDIGFFSIVEKPGDREAGMLTVRARVKGDLETLRKRFLPSLGATIESRDTDYRYRGRAPKADVAAAMAKAIEAVSYDNFKSRVRETKGPARERVLHRVWDELYRLQRP